MFYLVGGGAIEKVEVKWKLIFFGWGGCMYVCMCVWLVGSVWRRSRFDGMGGGSGRGLEKSKQTYRQTHVLISKTD